MNSEKEKHINEILSPIDQDLLNGLTEEDKEMLAQVRAYNLAQKEQKEKEDLKPTTEEQKLELTKAKEQELARIERKKKEYKENLIAVINKCTTDATDILKEVLSPLLGNASSGIQIDNAYYETLFFTRVSNAIGSDKTVCLELAEFIRSNKPKDILECYHFLNMFLLNQVTCKAIVSINKDSCSHEVIQEYMKVVIKSSSAFGKGMVALRNYRNGVNIIKNQNNTLNQVNINKE